VAGNGTSNGVPAAYAALANDGHRNLPVALTVEPAPSARVRSPMLTTASHQLFVTVAPGVNDAEDPSDSVVEKAGGLASWAMYRKNCHATAVTEHRPPISSFSDDDHDPTFAK
jgi:hypothetical protein